MRRALVALLLVALAAPAAAIQTFLPPGGVNLTSSAETELTPLETTFIVSGSNQGFFLLLNLLVTNHGTIDCQLRAELHNVAALVPDQVVTAPIKGNASEIAVQVPFNTDGSVLGLGPQTFQVFVTKSCGAAFDFNEASYLGIFSSTIATGVIGNLNGLTAFSQTFAVDSDETDLAISSSGSVHTFALHMAGAGASTLCIGDDCVASQTGGVCLGTGCSNTGAHGIGIGDEVVVQADHAIDIGQNPAGAGDGTVGVGYLHSHNATCDDGVIVGREGVCTGLHGIGIGSFAQPQASCISIGSSSTCGSAGVISMGNVFDGWTDLFLVLGGRLSLAAPPDVEIVPSAGTGTNVAGADMTIAGGNRTGNQPGGAVIFRTSSSGSTGTSAGTLAERWRITADGDLLPFTNGTLGIGNTTHETDPIYTEAIRDGTSDSGIELASDGSALPTQDNVQDLGQLLARWHELHATAVYTDELHGPTQQACIPVESLADTDDSVPFLIAPYAVTVTSVACSCVGTCTTLAAISLSDNSGNAMTISGGAPTCSKTTSSATYASVTAGGGLTTGEQLHFSVTNTPSANTSYLICATFVRP